MATTPSILDAKEVSPGAIKNIASQVGAASKGTKEESVFNLIGRGLSTLQNQIDAIFRHLRKPVGSDFFSSVVEPTQELTLTATTTNIVPIKVPRVGARLTVALTIDGTDGRQVTWDAKFKGVGVDTIDNRAGKKNIYCFIGLSDMNWWLTCSNLGL